MLVDAKFNLNMDKTMLTIMRHLSGSEDGLIKIRRHAVGVYEIKSFNFDHLIAGRMSFDQQYPDLRRHFSVDDPDIMEMDVQSRLRLLGENYFGCYGVCDNYQQVLEQCEELEKNPNRKFVLSVTEVRKDEQPESGGWRWHKWGQYIGNHCPQYEYLYDEVGIESVYCYHIYEIPESSIATDLDQIGLPQLSEQPKLENNA